MSDITKRDNDNFEIYTRGVKTALDAYHENFNKEFVQKMLTHPDDIEFVTKILDIYKDGFKGTLDGIDDFMNRKKNIELKIGGTNE
jgi:hypothetical protein